MRTAPTPGPRDAKSESAPEEENNPQNPSDTKSPDSADSPRSAAAGPAGPKKRTPALIFDDPLEQQSADDTDRGWGERPPGGDSASDLARFLDEKPPHHL
ncbi:hypothetical protein ACGF5F_21520 [Streptomyces sp. NPDC047821]|uniref:hypothetical protein n=1 Tax=Streptomyces sp. NPDC047821 TaxID=3365488 RepID=UPI00371B313C